MEGGFDINNFSMSGHLLDGHRREPCTLYVEDGVPSLDRIFSEKADITGIFVMDMVNSHTHCGDYGLKVPSGMSLEELVAPPDGLKHKYLNGLSDEELKKNMRSFGDASASFGSAAFVDFREGGVSGCTVLRSVCDDAIILGRPISKEYDAEEVADILDVADGIGLPSVSDMPLEYIEAVADDVRRARKIFSIHASERVREDIDFILSLDPAFIVHMCEATDDDLAKCAEAEVPIVICPTSNRYFGKEVPIVRMFDNGVDVGLGTDNGMLCEPDLITECKKLMDLVKIQGGDPIDASPTLSVMSSKLLNRTSRMMVKTSERYLTVVPDAGKNSADGHGIPVDPFRIRMNRG